MANKHMKKILKVISHREMQIQTMRYHFLPTMGTRFPVPDSRSLWFISFIYSSVYKFILNF
uniref:Uncharacterized protein n=1 Tax=Sus scrofa TaxID=9823 RepID=A0A4X1TNU8_PIG